MTSRRLRILLLGSLEKPYVAEAIETTAAKLRDHAEAKVLNLAEQVEDEPIQADFGLVFGGDGAILAAARRVAAAGVPLLGVNMGRLGFMAEITGEELAACVPDLLSGRLDTQDRMMLDSVIRREGQVLRQLRAVNDIVISREAHSRLIEMTVYINGEKVTTYAADGLILSTPTGSTAHSLAAGGPILRPDMEAIVIAPICPHTLSNRPLVIPSTDEIEVETYSRSVGIALTVDGQVFVELRNADRVRVTRSDVRLRLVRATARTFFETLRTKLQWGGKPYYGKS